MRVINHTRPDFPQIADIITLVEYIKGLYFTHAIKWICDICGYRYYDNDDDFEEKDIDPCLLILEQIEPKSYKHSDDVPLRKLKENVLNEYIQLPNKWFLDEGISYEVQKKFEIGFSIKDNCITIPIRDELGNLVGIKGRTILDYEKLNTSKYWYLYPTPKNLILYGLDKALPYIKETGVVFVYEAEKSVLKSFSYGIRNCVSIGGHQLSEIQILKLEKLNAKIIFAFDNDIKPKEVKKEASKFVIKDNLYMLYAHKNKGILGEKDSPIDKGLEVFTKLCKEDLYKIPV